MKIKGCHEGNPLTHLNSFKYVFSHFVVYHFKRYFLSYILQCIRTFIRRCFITDTKLVQSGLFSFDVENKYLLKEKNEMTCCSGNRITLTSSKLHVCLW